MRIKTAVLVAVVLAGNILYQENFDSAAVGWQGYAKHPGQWGWVATGGFAGGGYYHLYPTTATWGGDNFAILEGKNFTDFSFEAKIKIQKGNAGIQGRVTINDINASNPSLGGYRCVLGNNGNLRLQRYRLAQPSGYVGDYRNPLNLKEVGFAYQVNKWYTLKMEFSGNIVRCFVDGALKAEYTDTNSLTPDEISAGMTQNGAIFKNGTIGLVTYGAEVCWDEVKVENLSSMRTADLNGDGFVNGQDLTILKEKWGTIEADLNQDGKTNETDLTILLASWTGERVHSEWKPEDWFGSWKWQGNIRVVTAPEDDSLIIHWTNQPFEVIFWDGRDGGSKMPHWRAVGDNTFGVSPVWFESGDSPDYEPVFSDRSLIKLEVLEERNDFIRVRWWYKPTKDRQGSYGGTGFEVHRGNTEVEQIFDFYVNGLTEAKMTIKLGNQNYAAQSGNDLELSEWNYLLPKNTLPLSVIGRDGKIVKAMNLYGTGETSMATNGLGFDKNLANSWQGQVHIFYRKNPGADFFAIWGKKSQPQPPNFPDLYQKVEGLYYQNNINMVWSKPTCSTSAPLMTKAYLPSANYTANLTYKWLFGMGRVENLDLRKIARDYLDQGIVAVSLVN